MKIKAKSKKKKLNREIRKKTAAADVDDNNKDK